MRQVIQVILCILCIVHILYITEINLVCYFEHSHRVTENVDCIRVTERESISKQLLARIRRVQKNVAFGIRSKFSLLLSRNRVLCDCLWTEVVFVSGLSEAGTQAGFSLYRQGTGISPGLAIWRTTGHSPGDVSSLYWVCTCYMSPTLTLCPYLFFPPLTCTFSHSYTDFCY